jgi:hypothetical protein
MSASLEHQYRRALRWYPKSWRTRNEELMLGILMDAAEERGDNRPKKQVVSELRARGLEARFGVPGHVFTPAIRDYVSAIALGMGAAFSLWAGVASFSDSAGQSTWAAFYGLQKTTTFGPFLSLAVILYATWIAAFVTAVIGQRTVTRVILLATLPVAILARVLSEQLSMTAYISTTTVVMLEAFALFAVLAPATAHARWRIWMGAAVTGTIGWLTVVTLTSHQPLPIARSFGSFDSFERYFFMNTQPYIGWVCTIAPAIILVCVIIQRWTWAGVVSVLLTPWLALYAHSADSQREFGDYAAWLALGLGIIGLTTLLSAKSKYRIQITRR